jgi:hypothetical protein
MFTSVPVPVPVVDPVPPDGVEVLPGAVPEVPVEEPVLPVGVLTEPPGAPPLVPTGAVTFTSGLVEGEVLGTVGSAGVLGVVDPCPPVVVGVVVG